MTCPSSESWNHWTYVSWLAVQPQDNEEYPKGKKRHRYFIALHSSMVLEWVEHSGHSVTCPYSGSPSRASLHLAHSPSRTTISSRGCKSKIGFSPPPCFPLSCWGDSWNTPDFAKTSDSSSVNLEGLGDNYTLLNWLLSTRRWDGTVGIEGTKGGPPPALSAMDSRLISWHKVCNIPSSLMCSALTLSSDPVVHLCPPHFSCQPNCFVRPLLKSKQGTDSI